MTRVSDPNSSLPGKNTATSTESSGTETRKATGLVYKNIEKAWCILLFLASCFYMILFVMSSKTGWMQPETFIWKSQIIQDVKAGPWLDVIKRIFDLRIFEFAPRTTRPLASLFEIVDTVFRSYLWKFVTPHPSLSLSWIFTLIVSPLILYRILLLRGVSSFASFAMIGIYLTQMGTLSSVAMLFRSGKPVTLCLLMVSWYLCELLVRNGFEWKRYYLLLATLFVSSFFDEYTLLTYVFSAVLLANLLYRQPRLLMSFLTPGIVYLIAVIYAFPKLATTFYGLKLTLKNYDAEYGILVRISNFLQLDFVLVLLWDMWILIRESLCIYNPFEIPNLLDRTVMIIHLAVTIILLLFLLRRFLNKIISGGFKKTVFYNPSLTFILVCSIIAILFHGVTMFISSNKLWGPYYYGTFFGVFVTLFIAEIWKLNGIVRKITYVWTLTLLLSSMLTFPAINNAYKQTHYYPYSPVKIKNIFSGKSNRFFYSDKYFLPPDGINEISSIDWRKQVTPVVVPKHLLWVPIECAGMEYPAKEFGKSRIIAAYNISRNGVTPASVMYSAE